MPESKGPAVQAAEVISNRLGGAKGLAHFRIKASAGMWDFQS